MSLLDSFVFHNPVNMLYGHDAIEKLGPVIKADGVKKVLLLLGKESSKKNGAYDRTVKTLKDNGIDFVENWGVQPNPLVEKVRESIALAKSSNVDAVLAVGGGSVIDSAKAVAVGVFLTGEDIYDVYEKNIPFKKTLPVYDVLTLSATASEFNARTVISDPLKKEKLGTSLSRPIASAVDPTLQLTLPWRQVMCGAVDSLSHAMEWYFSIPNESITGRQVNLSVQRSIIKSMAVIRKDFANYNARASFCWAVGLAHNGVSNVGLSGDWGVHAIEHCISVYDDKIAHGEGLAVLSLQYYPWLYKAWPAAKGQFEEWAETVFGVGVLEAVAKLKALYIEWEAPLTLKQLGVPRQGIEDIAVIWQRQANLGRNSTCFKLNKAQVIEILTLAYE